MNTALANLGVFFGFGLFPDSLTQIAAACEFLRRRGHRHIVVAGHGVGGCMAIRYTAALSGTAPDPSAYGSRGPGRAPDHSKIFTYRSWWHLVGPEAFAAMAHRHVVGIGLPMLMLRGEHDTLVEAWEPAALARLAREAGNAHVRVAELPGAGHDCMENADGC